MVQGYVGGKSECSYFPSACACNPLLWSLPRARPLPSPSPKKSALQLTSCHSSTAHPQCIFSPSPFPPPPSLLSAPGRPPIPCRPHRLVSLRPLPPHCRRLGRPPRALGRGGQGQGRAGRAVAASWQAARLPPHWPAVEPQEECGGGDRCRGDVRGVERPGAAAAAVPHTQAHLGPSERG